MKSIQYVRYEIHLAKVRLANRVLPSSFSARRRFHKMENIWLHWGCGPKKLPNWVNIDGWKTDATDYVHDLRAKLPFHDETVELIFTEHVLEHVEFDIARQVLADFYRIMKPGGRIRIVVPGLEECIRAFSQGETGWFAKVDEPCVTVGVGFNRIFYSHFHRFIYDYSTLATVLKEAGFSAVEQSSHLACSDERLNLDGNSESRRLVSLYVDAVK